MQFQVFLHELNQRNFTSAVDEIMERLHNTDIEINYKKIPFDSRSSQEIHRQGKN